MITINQVNFATTIGLQKTREALYLAVDSYNVVCGIEFRIVSSGGRITFEPFNSDEVAGRNIDGTNRILISTIRNFQTVESLASIIMHEIGHTKDGPNWNHWPLQDSYADRIMHPFGSNTRWWHPREVQILQERYGKPRNQFYVPMVQDEAKRVNDWFHTRVKPAWDAYRQTWSDGALARWKQEKTWWEGMKGTRNVMAARWTSIPMVAEVYREWAGSVTMNVAQDAGYPECAGECGCRNLTPEAARELAKRFPPPQEWFDSEDNPFEP